MLPTNWQEIKVPVAWGVALFMAAIGGYAWVNETFATKDSVVVAATKADYALDIQMKSIIAAIQEVERKKVKDAYDINHLNYLRGELDRIQRLRTGK